MYKQRVFAKRDNSRRFRTDLTSKLLYTLYSHFGGSVSKEARSLLIRGKWEELSSLSVDPRSYSDPGLFARDYLVCELASKVPPDVSGSTPELLASRALKSFEESETQCKDTNQRLPLLDSTHFRNLYGHDVREVFCLARNKIEHALGNFSWDECSTLFGFGPGATTRLNRSRSDLYHKMGPKPHTTQHCLGPSLAAVGISDSGSTAEMQCYTATNLWAHQLIGGAISSLSSHSSADSPVEIVRGNKITTVPKNCKTDRTIAIEPDLNMFVQKGLGGVIRRRLRKVGINLDDQSRNQRLALAGSEDGSLATIDLKSASDTVASRLVELLLPPEWYRALNTTRSHCGVLPSGTLIKYEKFSSMGNGFTFELESLIFWGLSKGVAEYLRLKDRRLGVYGDDIVFPTQGAQLLLDVLKTAGFTPNSKKSFLDGPFRESCGKHYFRGIDVTPFYFRKKVIHPQPLFVAVNNLRRWMFRQDGIILSQDKWCLYRKWYKLVPSYLRRFRGPDGYGDGLLIGNFEEAVPARAGRGWEGWIVKQLAMRLLAPHRKRDRVDEPHLLLKSFYRLEKKMLEEGVPSDELATRLNTPQYRECKLLVLQWPSLGYPLS